jgi:hypothetical protein
MNNTADLSSGPSLVRKRLTDAQEAASSLVADGLKFILETT